jgi:UDP-N-acetylglucosamine 2-epimerase (non-hydrolysing)
MIKVLTVLGTRPEAIKLAPVIRELRRYPETFDSKVCVTHQHRELLDPMLELFDVKADYDLDLMTAEQTLTGVTSAVLTGLESILIEERPDWVMIQGDTITVMAASMAAFFQMIRVVHVEAGMRTFDKYSPFPEEINRRMTSVVADLHIAATELGATNLKREGVPENRIAITGNTVIDSLHQVAAMPFDPAGTVLDGLEQAEKLVVVTAHRRENFGEGMRHIAGTLRLLAEEHPELHLAYPVHLNPQARKYAYERLADLENVSLLPPLAYTEFVWLLKSAYFVITDSGGLQEEAAGLGKPALIMRENTERPEGVRAGIAKLVGTNRDELLACAGRLLRDPLEYKAMVSAGCPYGDGMAGERIIDALMGQHEARRRVDHIYEQMDPEDPLDALVNHDGRSHLNRRSSDRRLERGHNGVVFDERYMTAHSTR